jgi:hypothetical protein
MTRDFILTMVSIVLGLSIASVWPVILRPASNEYLSEHVKNTRQQCLECGGVEFRDSVGQGTICIWRNK